MVTYSLRAQYVGNYGGGTVAYGSYAQTFNIGTALTAGGGSFVVTDAELAAVLDRYPALYRSADDGQALIPAIQPRWSATSVGAGLAADQVAFEVRRSAESYARWQVLGDGSQTAGDGVSPPAAMPSLASMSTSITSLGVSVAAVETGLDLKVRNANDPNPVNTEHAFFSTTGEDPADILALLNVALTTPETAQILKYRTVETDSVGPPNHYEWGEIWRIVNTGDASVTAILATVLANSPKPIHSRARVFGVDGVGHAYESTMGAWKSKATVQAHGNNTLDTIVVTEPGSIFKATMPVTLTGTGLSIPGGTTITSITGGYGAPLTIVLSNPVTGTGPGTLVADPVGQSAINYLATANGELATDAAFQAQAQHTVDAFNVVLNAGASALQSTGKFLKLSSATADRFGSIESDALTDGIVAVNSSFVDTILEGSSGVTADSLIKAVASAVFGTAAIILNGQNISTDGTTGMKFATVSTQKTGLWGRTPIVRPAAITQNFTTTSRTVNAYTTDAESAAYAGIASGVAGTPYAQLTDLNNLRVAYENLRASYDNLLQVFTVHIDDEQAWGFYP